MKRIALMTLSLMIAASAAQAANDAAASRSAELRTKEQQVARSAAETKGGARQHFERQQQQIDHLINELEGGRAVDPREIDRILDRADQGVW